MNTIFINGVPVEMGSGNVYADLGYPDAEQMLIKAELVHQIQQTIDSCGLTQQQAACSIASNLDPEFASNSDPLFNHAWSGWRFGLLLLPDGSVELFLNR